MSAGQLRLRELLARLVTAEIRFVLVGGLAVNACLQIRVCSLESLLAMKRRSDRQRDREDVEALEGAHRQLGD